MRHESRGNPDGTEGPRGGELIVPMAWLYAEYIADELLRTGDLMPPTSFEYRAGRDALALTIFLADTEGELSGIRVVSQLETWLSLTAYGQPWQDWVRERMALLTAGAAEGPGPDLDLADQAWRWLQETELLAPDLDSVPGRAVQGEEDGPKVWTPAWRLGLPLGHLAIHLF
ncbi:MULTISPECIES: hypothetical protein [Streptomyces]|uniref:Uncharacterized protein n=1 Tax=Streptomyces venezuelae TaxID=54571 RepID=A0A5P2BNZ8_STRVZ|nr:MULTISPECIES: hypothetical protein [Streptomyces]NDZ99782.1 hypothetical protein [Streptomyces sp. SID10116]MYY84086.1 hypothetical protein [Streptomyces sp. SID335]MYZ14409.1 hypothetical protein [Streptomyces sp. SID337]NDZ84404.1 hypothetical protein [Streptomyces sp. SID10115]NEB42863.1 hypothetical protein [Streptomyces sp. SID339]